jgi:hypothetical protein
MQEIPPRYRQENGVSLIEIELNSVQQLFNSFDPSPFHERDLDADAEDYIVGAAREFPIHAPLKLVIQLPAEQMGVAGAANLAQSLHNYFDYRRDAAARDLRFQLRIGRTSLLIGLAFLAGCLLLRQVLITRGGAVAHIVGESLLIGGWVAMWRPIQIFLYDWWPLRRMQRVYAKLAEIPVELRPSRVVAISPAAKGSAAG